MGLGLGAVFVVLIVGSINGACCCAPTLYTDSRNEDGKRIRRKKSAQYKRYDTGSLSNADSPSIAEIADADRHGEAKGCAIHRHRSGMGFGFHRSNLFRPLAPVPLVAQYQYWRMDRPMSACRCCRLLLAVRTPTPNQGRGTARATGHSWLMMDSQSNHWLQATPGFTWRFILARLPGVPEPKRSATFRTP